MARTCVFLLFLVVFSGLTACGGGGESKAVPLITEVVPISGGVDGGTLVTVSGLRLSNEDGALPGVTFDGVIATDVTVLDDSTLTCLTPAGTAGTVDVAVFLAHGTFAFDGFTYFPAPTVTGVQPPRGAVGGGETIRIFGTGFQDNVPGPATVMIGAGAAINVVVLDDMTLTCQAPGQPGLGLYDVTVTNANGERTLPSAYEIVPPPTVTGVTEASGPAGGYRDVTVSGSRFDDGVLSVRFGTQLATQVVVVDAATLTCRTPPGAAGTVDVEVRTYGGAGSASNLYTYTTWSPDDPLFGDQWHLENTEQHANSTADEDAQVVGAWDLGWTGQGVKVAVVDDGLEIAHEDLVDNVVAGASWDYGDNDSDPTRNQHGTSVAGVSSASGGNLLGGVGAAPNSKLAGFAVLTAGASDADFADALTRGAPTTHLYNNSWGSPAYYNGVLLGFSEAPYSFHAALANGLRAGRAGLGSIYIKSAGNSGIPVAGFDGTNGIRGINVIGAVNSDGSATFYSQPGPCLLICASSNDTGGRPAITTTDRTGAAGYDPSNYTSSFGGTSSSGPLVTGVAALVLEARPELRWWEVPLVLALSARRNDEAHSGWVQNGAGHWVNQQYGFGVVDARAAVEMAASWTPRTGLVSTTVPKTVDRTLAAGDTTGITSTLTIPADTGMTGVHTATITVFLDHPFASDLNVVLTSPDGTESQFLKSIRTPTTAANALTGIPMVSRRHLDETAAGDWTLTISEGQNLHACFWSSWSLTLEGEGTAPLPTLMAKPAAGASPRPPAPLVSSSLDIVWWDGGAWRTARQDPSLVAEWKRDLSGAESLGGREKIEGAEVEERGLTIWRLRRGQDSRRLLSADEARPARAWPVFRDGPGGNGRLRALTGRVVLQLDPELSNAQRRRLERNHGLVLDYELAVGEGWRLYRLAPGVSPLDAAAALLEADGVLHAAPDWWRERSPY